MVGSRTVTLAVGLAASLLVSYLAWRYFDTLFLFFVLPFVPILFRRRGGDAERPAEKRCPACGFRTRNPAFEHCPYDGAELEDRPRN